MNLRQQQRFLASLSSHKVCGAASSRLVVASGAGKLPWKSASLVIGRRSLATKTCEGKGGLSATDGVGTYEIHYVLPLYRKPAFPGFYHIIQIRDSVMLDYLDNLKRTKNTKFLGGFLTKKLPAVTTEEKNTKISGASSNMEAQQQRLRSDTGVVDSGDELEEVGTLLEIVSLAKHPRLEGGQVVVLPLRRIQLVDQLTAPSEGNPLWSAQIKSIPNVKTVDNKRVRALHHSIIATMKALSKIKCSYTDQLQQVLKYYNLDDSLKLADLVAGMSTGRRDALQNILEENNLESRLHQVLMVVVRDLEDLQIQSRLEGMAENRAVKDQRRFMLMEHLKHIKKELGIPGSHDQEFVVDSIRKGMAKLKDVPAEAMQAMEEELDRLSKVNPSASQYVVSKTYLEWMIDLPWGKTTKDTSDITYAECVLNKDHHGLKDVKERILEFIAVGILKKSMEGKIICLVGPPGVGKTSVGRSIAKSLNRKFFHFSVGGLRDVTELRGTRRTYVGAMPGKIIQALKSTGASNPVVLLDEVDKVGGDQHGSPSSALLEILDPAQNNDFRDHYMDVPVDLSKILFICTANTTNTIPAPLMDRMESIVMQGYVLDEKLAIAREYLIPKTLSTHGLSNDALEISDEVLVTLAQKYILEVGVRQLQRLVEKIVRKVALSVVRSKENAQKRAAVTLENLTEYVGQPVFPGGRLFPGKTPPGVATGLTNTSQGGQALFVETSGSLRRGKEGSIFLTGHGDDKTIAESSKVAYSYAADFLHECQPGNSFLDEAKIHVNFMCRSAMNEAGVGVTFTSALLGLALHQSIKRDLAMTGEVTLTGRVVNVKDIKEKVLAARRENISSIVFPLSNKAEYVDLNGNLKAGLTAHFVDHYRDIYRLVFDGTSVPELPAGSPASQTLTIVTPPS